MLNVGNAERANVIRIRMSWLRLTGFLVVVGCVVPRSLAEEQHHVASGPATTVEETQTSPPAASPAATALQKPNKSTLEKEAAARLNGTEWSLELTPMQGEKPKRPLTDALRFTEGKIESKALSSQGYPVSNYTLTVGDDGIPVWETMQTSKTEGVVFWRGELHDEHMRGVLSKHPLKGDAQDYSFSGTQAKASTKRSAAQSTEASTTQPEQSTQPQASQGGEVKAKKAKKRWFGR